MNRTPEAGGHVVVVDPYLPHDQIAHAGGVHLHQLHSALDSRGAAPILLAEDSQENRAAKASERAPSMSVLFGPRPGQRLTGRLLAIVIYRWDRRLRLGNPSLPRLKCVVGLLLEPSLRRIVSGARIKNFFTLELRRTRTRSPCCHRHWPAGRCPHVRKDARSPLVVSVATWRRPENILRGGAG